MENSVRALLIGIDRYRAPVAHLRGWVNNIQAFADYLRWSVDSADGARLALRVLTGEQDTHDAFNNGFRKHLKPARWGDVALFYYAGHGLQEQTPPKIWHLESNRLNETRVCHDSRLPGGWDLADKELAKLIDEVASGVPRCRQSNTIVKLTWLRSAKATRGGWP